MSKTTEHSERSVRRAFRKSAVQLDIVVLLAETCWTRLDPRINELLDAGPLTHQVGMAAASGQGVDTRHRPEEGGGGGGGTGVTGLLPLLPPPLSPNITSVIGWKEVGDLTHEGRALGEAGQHCREQLTMAAGGGSGLSHLAVAVKHFLARGFRR